MKRLAIILGGLTLTACATTQMTSGAVYNARSLGSNYATNSTVDAEIADIAAIEPNLSFPARIGIAYIQRGQLQAVPSDHLQSWSPLVEKLQPGLGEIVPISPLIAQMVAKTDNQTGRVETINNIRRGAARQHVDYVLIYEAAQTHQDKRSNALSITDLSVIGLFIIPSRNIEVEATASAIFLDVRNGYPYGTATGLATKDGLTSATKTGSKRRKLQDRAEIAAVDALAADVGVMFDTLIADLVTG
jgi:hypothetical protein